MSQLKLDCSDQKLLSNYYFNQVRASLKKCYFTSMMYSAEFSDLVSQISTICYQKNEQKIFELY